MAQAGVALSAGSWPAARLVGSPAARGRRQPLHASAIEVYQDKAYRPARRPRAELTVGTKSAGHHRGRRPRRNRASVIGRRRVPRTTSGVRRTAHHSGATRPPPPRRVLEGAEAEIARAAKLGGDPGGRPAAPRTPPRAGAGTAVAAATTFATVGETLIKLETPEDVARLALTVGGDA